MPLRSVAAPILPGTFWTFEHLILMIGAVAPTIRQKSFSEGLSIAAGVSSRLMIRNNLMETPTQSKRLTEIKPLR